MAKFTAGSLPRTLKRKGHLPGIYTYAFGPRYIDVAKWDSASALLPEFGEFVELNVGDDYAKEASTMVAGTTASELAVIVRDVTGAPAIGGGIISGPKAEIPLSVFIGTAGNKGKIVAILGEQDTTPAIGGAVYVGTGVSATVAGVIYTTDVGIECITATNWQFAGLKFAPTTSGNYVVEVEYTG
jgi:roadblock/LC7 domain-containing protein